MPSPVYAMQQGKHVASEVPAAATIEECWELVKTAEGTRRHLMMLENYSYMDFHLQTIMMAKDGFFGGVLTSPCSHLSGLPFISHPHVCQV